MPASGTIFVMGPASRLRAVRGTGLAGLLGAARVLGLAALVWAVANEHTADGAPTVPPELLVATGVGWVGWLASRRRGAPAAATWVFLAILAGAGGAVAGFAPVGIAFPAVAVLASAMLFDTVPALVVAGIGAATLTVTVWALGAPGAIIAEGLLAIVAAVLGGASRRQYQDRAAQAEELLAERVRADAERDRAAALAERNRIGREVHDVLAHSLGALSVQLEAADAVLEGGAEASTVRPFLQQARRLAVEGLSETRAAVHALRDEPVALAEQLAALAAADEAEISVTGTVRALSADAGLALYRAAQEAVSNARKHAPGAAISVCLNFDRAATVLIVTNGPCPRGGSASLLSQSGGGFGLRGMRERIELLGGNVLAEPREQGWTVQVAVPA
jgi:signal transduction histidine kinase